MSFLVLFSDQTWLFAIPKAPISKNQHQNTSRPPLLADFGPKWPILGIFGLKGYFPLGVTITQYGMRDGQNGAGAFFTPIGPLYPTKLCLGPNFHPILRSRGFIFEK